MSGFHETGDNRDTVKQTVVVVSPTAGEVSNNCLNAEQGSENVQVSTGTTGIIQTVPTIIETSEAVSSTATAATVTVQYLHTSADIATAEDVTTSANAEITLNGLHQELALNQDVLVCGHCHQQYIDIVEFLNHKAEHQTPAGNHRCELCRKTFSTGIVAIDHYQTKHKIVFPDNTNSNNANHHLMIETSRRDEEEDEDTDHQVETTHRMDNQEDVCDFQFILVTEKVKGTKFDYGKTAFKCLHCSFKCQSKTVLVKHMTNKHSDQLDHATSVDRDATTMPANENERLVLMSDYNKMNRLVPEPERGKEEKKRKISKRKKEDQWGVYPCSVCGKIFNRARSLRVHLETHRTEKNFLCDECGKAFKSQTRLRVHRRVHKDKVFKCTQCEFQSNINAAIHAHRQMHTQGSVLCDICGFAYTDKSTLTKHLRVHSEDRPFGCTFEGCTWRFKSEAMFKAHLRAHTSDGKFKCSYCGYLFRHKHHLQRHESKMHGIKIVKSVRKEKIVTELADVAISDAGTQPMQQIIVADSHGNPITTYEQAEFTALHYQTLMQTPETRILQAAQDQENQTISQQ
ncbi:uncharacterized protein LOC144437708 [Glandiceps talaboti]